MTFQFAPLHVFTFPSFTSWLLEMQDVRCWIWVMTDDANFLHSKLKRMSASVTTIFLLRVPFNMLSLHISELQYHWPLIFLPCNLHHLLFSSITAGGRFYPKFDVRVCYPATAESGRRIPELRVEAITAMSFFPMPSKFQHFEEGLIVIRLELTLSREFQVWMHMLTRNSKHRWWLLVFVAFESGFICCSFAPIVWLFPWNFTSSEAQQGLK